MGHRVTGKQMVERRVSEQYCDQCGKIIPPNKYPEIFLELTSGPWEDSAEYMDYCSWSCLITYAQSRHSDSD